MKKKIIFFQLSLLFVFFQYSCKNHKSKNPDFSEIIFDTVELKYAKGFQILTSKNLTKISILSPWQKADNIKFDYFITDNDSIYQNFPEKDKIFKNKINKIVCLSTTHIGYLDIINKKQTIVGLSGTDYVFDDYLCDKISNNQIIDVGYDQNINYEIILTLKPDAVFIYGIESDVSSRISKLKDLGIKTVFVSEYLEETPLARAEWIKFFGYFFNETDITEEYFNFVENEYHKLLRTSDTILYRPKILINVPYNGIWWLPGGKSYMAEFIKDAAGFYPWNENMQKESFSVDFENIFLKSKDAAILINPGIYNKIADIISIDERITNIEAVKNKNVYNNNKRTNSKGGNDFWESGNVKPHIILEDLMKIFHPNIFSEDSLFFYLKLD